MASPSEQDENVTTSTLDHHGLVAAACKDLDLSKRIDARIGSSDPRRRVQPGTAVVAMILNGLGFTNRRLYLTPQFFASKAVEDLFDADITAKELNDHALGKALDDIADYGASRLYGEVAFEIALEHGLLGKNAHLDSTSFGLHGQYDSREGGEETIRVTHGFSKDHRPDLKQVVLSMTVTGGANIPIWMEPQSGNTSDKKSFHETIERVRNFQAQLKEAPDFVWIADSALYSADKLLSHNDARWIARVPETIGSCASLLSKPDHAFSWTELGNGYKFTGLCCSHAGIQQKWVVVSSQQAYERESKTFERKLSKSDESLSKACWHQCAQ